MVSLILQPVSVGHAGAMLQARRLGNELFVGVHSDEAILDNKGPTVMTLKERLVYFGLIEPYCYFYYFLPSATQPFTWTDIYPLIWFPYAAWPQ